MFTFFRWMIGRVRDPQKSMPSQVYSHTKKCENFESSIKNVFLCEKHVFGVINFIGKFWRRRHLSPAQTETDKGYKKSLLTFLQIWILHTKFSGYPSNLVHPVYVYEFVNCVYSEEKHSHPVDLFIEFVFKFILHEYIFMRIECMFYKHTHVHRKKEARKIKTIKKNIIISFLLLDKTKTNCNDIWYILVEKTWWPNFSEMYFDCFAARSKQKNILSTLKLYGIFHAFYHIEAIYANYALPKTICYVLLSNRSMSILCCAYCPQYCCYPPPILRHHPGWFMAR